MSQFPPHERFLFEIFYRALQMVANGIKKYIEMRAAAAGAIEQDKETQQ